MITARELRVIGPEGEQLGILEKHNAIAAAEDLGLDLVEVAPTADPPVCRIMDFGKFRYQESLKRKEARKSQQGKSLKEIKYHANVGDHDYQTKLGHARAFLEKGHKVKLSLMFRGRENAHRELGFEVINRAIADCADIAVPEMTPRLMGRSIICLLGGKATKG